MLYTHACYAVNIEWSKWTSRGAGVIIKMGIRCEEVMGIMEYVCSLKSGQGDNKFEWLVGSVYKNCEEVRKEENILKLVYIKKS